MSEFKSLRANAAKLNRELVGRHEEPSAGITFPESVSPIRRSSGCEARRSATVSIKFPEQIAIDVAVSASRMRIPTRALVLRGLAAIGVPILDDEQQDCR